MQDTQIITAEHQHIIDRVRLLADNLNALKSGISDAATQAAITAHHLGSELTRAHQELEQGCFDLLLETASIEGKTASKLIKYAATFSLEDVKNADPNALRQGMLSFGALPDKQAMEIEGNEPIKISPGIQTIVNKWSALMSQVASGKVRIDVSQARRDTRALYEWLKGIHAEDAK